MLRTATLLAIALLSLPGCSTFTIDTRYDKDYAYGQLRSFAWSNLAPDISGGSEYARPEVDEAIRTDLTRAFASRGFYEADDPQSADFLIAYRLIVENRLTERVLNDGYEVGPGWGPEGIDARQYAHKTQETFVIEYSEGTLVVDVSEPESRRLLWRGSVQGELHEAESWPDRRKRMQRAMRDLLKRFPPD